MLEFVERLTLAPWDIAPSDRAALESAGWHRFEAIQIVLGCAHFNYLNRMADGLGISFEYPTSIERFEKGLGDARREAFRKVAAPTTRRTPVREHDTPPALHPDTGAAALPPRLTAILSFHPELARAIGAWRGFQMRGTDLLDTARRARIALFAAAVEHCESARNDLLESVALADSSAPSRKVLAAGEVPSSLAPIDQVLLHHTRRLLTAPATMTEADVLELRSVGLDDREIVRTTMLVSYLSFEHRARAGLTGLDSSGPLAPSPG